jgi:predicted Zn-dependent protease with MMP-like domain
MNPRMVMILLLAYVNCTFVPGWLDTCRKTSHFEPFDSIQASYSEHVPARYRKVIDELLSSLKDAIHVRVLPGSTTPQLKIQFKMCNSIKSIAFTETEHRDACQRPDEGSITISKPWFTLYFKKLKEILFHEIMHLMGFDQDDYKKYYIFGNNWKSNLLYGFVYEENCTSCVGTKVSYYAASPTVKEIMNQIVPNSHGAPMDVVKHPQGIDIPGEHWHQTKYNKEIGHDIMRPKGLTNNLTKVTTAFINDFGWYHIDHNAMLKLLNQKPQ